MLLNRNIHKLFISLLLPAIGLVSCKDDLGQEGVGSNNSLKNPAPYVTFNVKSITTGVRSSDTPVERIASLRIIMLNDGKIEMNKWISFTGEDPNGNSESSGQNVTEFNQYGQKFVIPTVPGKKSFFFIANEAQIGKVKFNQDDISLIPDELSSDEDLTFKGLMTYYSGFAEDVTAGFPNEDGVMDFGFPDKTAGEFEAVMNALYFAPYYTPDDNGNVYLVYTSFYDNDGKGFEIFEDSSKNLYDSNGNVKLQDMFLVPCATKFQFKFINYRTTEVAVDYLKLESVQEENYLMACLNETEQNKYFDGVKLYWIEWLKRVSEASQEYPSQDANVGFNSVYNWISDYKTPNPEIIKTIEFVPEGPADLAQAPFKSSSWLIKAAENNEGDPIPVIEDFGPFYLPEAKNMVEEKIYNKDPNAQPEEGAGEEGEEDDDTDVDTDPDETTGSDTGVDNGTEQDDDLNTPEEDDDDYEIEISEKYILDMKLRMATADFDSTRLNEVRTMKTQISNLKSLFRNTCVQITITLREGGVHIYAEPVEWTTKVFNGYIKDEDEIN